MLLSSDLLLACADPREGDLLQSRCGRSPFVLGVGKAAAATALTGRLARHQISAVLLFGVAGAYAAHDDRPLDVLDLAFVGESVFGDEGVATPAGFLDFKALGLGSTAPLDCDPELLAQARSILGPLPVVRCATVSTGAGTDALAEERAVRTGARLETMESAAVALACHRFAVPMLELRCVSNRTGDRARGAFDLTGACACVQDAVVRLLAAWPDSAADGAAR